MNNFHNFKAKTITGEEISMSNFKDNVVLVVNTASKCGLTSQFEGLQKLHEEYQSSGLKILGFPCNQWIHKLSRRFIRAKDKKNLPKRNSIIFIGN